jgi:hypothetical protein
LVHGFRDFSFSPWSLDFNAFRLEVRQNIMAHGRRLLVTSWWTVGRKTERRERQKVREREGERAREREKRERERNTRYNLLSFFLSFF